MSLTSEAVALAHLAKIELEVSFFPFKPYFEEEEEEVNEHNQEIAVSTLRRICAIVREAEANGIPDISAILDKADKLIDDVADKTVFTVRARGRPAIMDSMPSFADSLAHPVIEVKGRSTMALTIMRNFDNLMNSRPLDDPMTPHDNPEEDQEVLPWNKTRKAHEKSTYLARFHKSVLLEPSVGLTSNIAALCQARCEITADSINTPTQLVVSPSSSRLAWSSATGPRYRIPVLKWFNLGEDIASNECRMVRGVESGMKGLVFYMVIDDSRNLLVAADADRVKTYDLSSDNAYLVHTLDCGDYSGDIHVVDGKIIRAGTGSLAVWAIDELPTHEDESIIGEEMSIDDLEDSGRVWDELENVELSRGTPHSNTLTLQMKTLPIYKWHPHPLQPSRLLCASIPVGGVSRCAIHDIDIQTGASVTRFLGHAGVTRSFSTSPDEPNTFVTGCEDGYARLFDVRHPLPVLTFDAAKSNGECMATSYCTPDGVPYVFTAALNQELMTLWDVRMRRPVYDLSTGNTSVVSMAWDDQQQTLWAATECKRVFPPGYTFGNRAAKIPEWSEWSCKVSREWIQQSRAALKDPDAMEEDKSGDEDDEYGPAWPAQGLYNEDYFGYTYDAGRAMLFRYHFKEDPDTAIMPEYGQAIADRDVSDDDSEEETDA